MEPIVKNLDKKLPELKTVLKYRPRSGVFKDSSGNCDFDPVTGLGHSYNWYEITKVIKGVLVLNDFGYSPTTRKHVSKIDRLFSALKLKYIMIEAPKGLQSLDSAREHIASLYGRGMVELNHSRDGKPGWKLMRANTCMKNARKIGITFPNALLKDAVARAEIERTERLVRNRAEKARLKSITDTAQRAGATLVLVGAQ